MVGPNGSILNVLRVSSIRRIFSSLMSSCQECLERQGYCFVQTRFDVCFSSLSTICNVCCLSFVQQSLHRQADPRSENNRRQPLNFLAQQAYAAQRRTRKSSGSCKLSLSALTPICNTFPLRLNAQNNIWHPKSSSPQMVNARPPLVVFRPDI
jgi:hypothetical protein